MASKGASALRRQLACGSALVVLASACAGAALAQAQPADDTQVGEVVVTASRVARTGFSAPTPTVVIGSETLERRGAVNVAQVLQELPSVKASSNPQTNGTNQRQPGASYADLRGLGAGRTLVLVDGRRFVPQVVSGVSSNQVDLNQIPALMIDRSEVVTGGASAQWGSDAIGGVVNLILKKNFTGFQMEAQVGQSQYGDNRSGRIAFLAGTGFAGGKGHVELSGDYARENGVRDISNRPWGRPENGGFGALVTNPCPNQAAVSANCPTGGNGQAERLILPNVQFGNLTPGGIINTAGPLHGIAFGPGGVPYNFQYGQYVTGASSQFQVGGGQPGIAFLTGQMITPPYRRANLYLRSSYDLTDHITGWVEGSYAWEHGGGPSTASRNAAYTIRSDNPYIPASVKAIMTANNITSFALGHTNFDIGVTTGDDYNFTGRFAGGLNGTLPIDGNWKWDLTAGYGQNRNVLHIRNNLIGGSPTNTYLNMTNAVDAVAAPAGNILGVPAGTIVCRSTLTNPANGCQPINLFGYGSPSQLAKQYVQGTEYATTIYKQTTVSGNVTGEPFSTWAGPVSVATGFEYREESQASNTDLIAQSGSYEGNNGSDTNGKFNVKEVYGETVIPLAHDVAWAKSFDLNGAIRYADYSTKAGGQMTWKVGGVYTPFTGLLIRAARSHDIRAPNIFELANPGTNLNSTINYPATISVRQLTKGNADLTAEVANTTTAGFSYSPSFVSGLQFSVDYYKIDLNNAISSLTAQQIADLCRLGGQASACSLITFSGGVPISVLASPLNLASVQSSGYDIQISYRTPLSRFGANLPGTVSINFGGNYVLHSTVNTGVSGAQPIDRAGEVGGPNNPFSIPHFRFTNTVVYDVGPLSISGQMRFIGRGKFDNTYTPLNINNNRIGSQTYFDFSANYKIKDRWEVFGVMNNAFNHAPPLDPSAFTSMTNPVYYDTVGRTFKIGIRYKH
ncbi:MAG: TonB-dependent receptor [Caulobacteraceae bacterium]